MDASIVLTYRCNSRCVMCNTWQCPTDPAKEITPREIEALPDLDFVNITGGEPFLRDDISDVLDVVQQKAPRIVISTNGFLTERIARVMDGRDHKVGVRVSLDGLGDNHARVRGVPGAYGKAMATLRTLREMGVPDIGFSITVSDHNAHDLLPMFYMAESMNIEFAIAVTHNGYYFHKYDNVIRDADRVAGEFEKLIRAYLSSKRPKNWFRAYMASGVVDHIYGRTRPLKCMMASMSFFVDPYGQVQACNVRELPMGNLRERSFADIWQGEAATDVRAKVASCNENCWMIGSVSCLMRKKVWIPALWVLRHKWTYSPRAKPHGGGAYAYRDVGSEGDTAS